jgi:hypothetical protein
VIGADLSPFFIAGEFAEDATRAGVSVLGIFDSTYVSAGEGLGMASTAPVFTLPTANVPATPVGLPLLVRGVGYVVAAHEPDGAGVSLLRLERAV